MIIKEGCSIAKFLEAVQHCDGDVFLSTQEGDLLNLKSTLCGYIFAVVINNVELRETSSIICKRKEDEKRLCKFLIEG